MSPQIEKGTGYFSRSFLFATDFVKGVMNGDRHRFSLKKGTGYFSMPFLLAADFVKGDRHRFSLDCAVETEPVPEEQAMELLAIFETRVLYGAT